MFEKIISVKMDHRVSISSIIECIEWPIALNDHWRWKWKMKFEISKVEKFKLENQKKNLKSKNVRKIISVKMDHGVSISSNKWPFHWMIIEDENQKWNLKFRYLKSWSRKIKKKIKSKNVRKIYKCPNGSPSQHL